MKPAFLLASCAFISATFILTAQIGIPGTYPPGQNPNRYPGGSPGGGRGSRRTTREEKPATHTEVVSGVVRKLDADSFELEVEDTRFLIIQFSSSVPRPADLRVGDGLDVTASGDADGMFHLVSIRTNKEIAETINEADSVGPLPGGAAPEEGRTGPPPTILVRPDAAPDSDDSGPPKLIRGKPAARASTSIPDDDAPRPRAKPAPPANPHMALIEQARE